MIEESVLHDYKLYACLEACTAELGCLLSIQAGDVRELKVGSLLKLC